ncbi:MAG: hypothetical protein M1820_000756 [Bogoriella megaspora]|nr:MAG: hypothetical protein M1820_000756 [Bogoriella megaspora]
MPALMGLPTEIRLRIFSFVLPEDETLTLPDAHVIWLRYRYNRLPSDGLGLLYVNQQIRSEAEDILFKVNTIRVCPLGDHRQDIMRHKLPAYRWNTQLRRLRLEINVADMEFGWEDHDQGFPEIHESFARFFATFRSVTSVDLCFIHYREFYRQCVCRFEKEVKTLLKYVRTDAMVDTFFEGGWEHHHREETFERSLTEITPTLLGLVAGRLRQVSHQFTLLIQELTLHDHLVGKMWSMTQSSD